MIQVRLKGGLGNQMFQYAFGQQIAKKLNDRVIYDCALLLDRGRGEEQIYRDYDLEIFKVQPDFSIPPFLLRLLFKIKHPIVGGLLRKWTVRNFNYLREKHFHVMQELIDAPMNQTYYDGWWQSPFYFSEVETELREAFSWKNDFQIESRALAESIRNTESVCLNVRRTDFVTNPVLNATDINYFNRGVGKIAELVQNPHLFIFSDDMDWCRKNLTWDLPMTFVTHEHKGYKFGNYLQLMSNCKYFIIPNSTFAWWAVWLSPNRMNPVIAPKNWFTDRSISAEDLVPKNWIRL